MELPMFINIKRKISAILLIALMQNNCAIDLDAIYLFHLKTVSFILIPFNNCGMSINP